MDVDEVKHFLTGEPIAKVGRANAGLIQRDMRKASAARDALRKIPVAELIARMKVAGDLYMNAELPLGDGSQTPDDFAKQQSASTGLARRAVPREHEEESVRAQRDGQHPQVADARARSERADDRLRRRERRADQLSGAEPGARARAAVEFARRAHAVAADHPDADRARAEAGPAGAVDAVSRRRSVFSGGHSARSDFDLSRRSRSRRGGGRRVRPQPDLRRHADGRALQGQSARAGARARDSRRSSSATTASTTGSATST